MTGPIRSFIFHDVSSYQPVARSPPIARLLPAELSPMTKTLCELKKLVKNDLKRYAALVNQPTHVCTNCGRAANSKKLLCKPEKIKD